MTRIATDRSTRRRIAIAILALLSLLFQSAFVIACDVHDLGHAVSSEGNDQDIGCPDSLDPPEPQSPPSDESTWHDVFAVGHCMSQIFQSVSSHTLLEPTLSSTALPILADRHILPAPLGSLLRPPIIA